MVFIMFYDKSLMSEIEKMLCDSDFGVNLVNDGIVICVVLL